MQASHVADDYAAIARRLKEIQEEGRRAAEPANGTARPWLGYPTGRSPRPSAEPKGQARR